MSAPRGTQGEGLDLMSSHCVPGADPQAGAQGGNPYRRVRRPAAKSHGRALGRLVSTVEEGAALYGAGFDMIIYSGDVWLLAGGLSDGVQAPRATCGD